MFCGYRFGLLPINEAIFFPNMMCLMLFCFIVALVCLCLSLRAFLYLDFVIIEGPYPFCQYDVYSHFIQNFQNLYVGSQL